MIRDFWVKNYRSIYDKQELSFLTDHSVPFLTTEVEEGVFLYKLGILYGANASGKTNMLLAMNDIFRLLTLYRLDLEEIYKSFVYTKEQPIEMHVSFYADDTRYDYDVKFNDKYILNEMLCYYQDGSKSLFYERWLDYALGLDEGKKAPKIKFGKSLGMSTEDQERIRRNTSNSTSVLAVCGDFGANKKVNSLCIWVKNFYFNRTNNTHIDLAHILSHIYWHTTKERKFYDTMLSNVGLSLLDQVHPKDYGLIIDPCDKELYGKAIAATSTEGVKEYLRIIGMLYNMRIISCSYRVDDFGKGLHPDLLLYCLKVFLFNSEKSSQLIITSQETTLMMQDFINENRGIVWFVEKDPLTTSSKYHRGDSFDLNKDASLFNAYTIGKLGAKPFTGSAFMNLNE